MILVDTSVWVDHLRAGDTTLVKLLGAQQVLIHPFVVGELALGHLPQRRLVLNSLRLMPQVFVASHEEVLHFVDKHKLSGLGIGYLDAHLLASTQLTAGVTLWTRDKRLRDAANGLALAADLPS